MANETEPSTGETVAGTLILLLIPLLLVSIIPGFGAWYTVQDGQRAVETQFGAIEEANIGPGLHFKLPIVDGVSKYNVRAQSYTMAGIQGKDKKANSDVINALTSEGLNVKIAMTVRYNIEPNKTGYLYQNVATNDEGVRETIVRPTVRTAIRSSSSQYSVEEIYSTKRDEFATDIKQKVREQFEDKGLNVQAIQIRNIMLPEKVRMAIQKKQAAQERIATKRKKLKIAKLEKKRKIIEARGIAKSNRIIGSSLSKQYLQWYWIQEGLEKGDSMYVIRNAPGDDINGTSANYGEKIGPELVKNIDSVGNETITNETSTNETATAGG